MEVKVALAGTFAGVVGTILGYPFDVVKTKMQVNPTKFSSMGKSFFLILIEEGPIRGFYRGVGSPLLSLTILNTINFSNYDYCKKMLALKTPDRLRPLDLNVTVAGMLIGPFASIISTPFELIKTQMQLAASQGDFSSKGSVGTAWQIIHRHGFKGLYVGHTINTLREILFLGTYFSVYEHSKAYSMTYAPSSMAIALSGGFAGATGWLLSYPLDCVKSNIQGLSWHKDGFLRRSTVSVAKDIYLSRGVFGLYSGVAPSVTRAFFVSASRFSAYEFALFLLS